MMTVPRVIKFIRTAKLYLEPLYFFTVILASTIAVATFVYTVASDKEESYQVWLSNWRIKTIRSIIINSEKDAISFQEIRNQYQNRIDREEKVNSVNFSSQDVNDDSLRYTLQVLVDQGTLRQTEENNYDIVDKAFDPWQTAVNERLQEEREFREVQNAIEDVLIGNPLDYDADKLEDKLENKLDNFEEVLFRKALTQLRINGVVLDENGMLYHNIDSITIPSTE